MADIDLISAGEFAEIRDELNTVMYTFLKRPIIYRMDKNTRTRWQKDIDKARDYDNKNLNGLVVKLDGEKAKTEQKLAGAIDFGEGYVLLRYDDCVTQGIIDGSKNFAAVPAQDRITFNGIEHYVTGIVSLGQLSNDEVVVKVYYRKDLIKA